MLGSILLMAFFLALGLIVLWGSVLWSEMINADRTCREEDLLSASPSLIKQRSMKREAKSRQAA